MNTPLTPFEQQIMQLVALGDGQAKWSWYSIATRVVYEGRDDEVSVMVVLKKLEALELVHREREVGNSFDHWTLTDIGKHLLQTLPPL